MHRIPSENSEREADQFASEFLMPAREIVADLNYFTLQRAASLKPYWKVSMAALIMRAHSLDKITDSQKTSLFKQLAAANYRTKEPDTVPIEKPTVIMDIINTYLDQMDYTVGDLAHLVALEEDEFRYIYLGENSDHHGLRVIR
jgi:Zn-dependent peptidase ImmA (M78 family)